MGTLDGKVALVTGAGRGLGRACAEVFAREGAKVIVATLTPEKGEETVKLIKDAGGDATFIQTDVAKSEDCKRMVQCAVETYGGLDYAINNAYRNAPILPIGELDEDDWDKAIAVNFAGIFRCMKYEIQAMLVRGGGAIVNVGSGNEGSVFPGRSWYLPAKQGLYGLTKTAALEYGAKGIRVNAVSPGPMWTDMMRIAMARDPTLEATRVRQVPLGHIAEPEEVAKAAVWLCTPTASYVHGHTLVVDGGFLLTKF